jgi:hypothetical protein
MKVSWHTDGDQLVSEWGQSEIKETYHPAWMQSSYPAEACTGFSPPINPSLLSPFGRPGIIPPREAVSQTYEDHQECHAHSKLAH